MSMIDVSDWQGAIDWAKVKAAGIEVAGIKLTEGTDYEDPRAKENVEGAKAHAIRVIPYHFARPDHHPTPDAEITWFKEVCAKLGVENEQPALDLEVGSGDLSEYAVGFMSAIGHDCLLYSDSAFIGEHLTRVPNSHPLWVAEYDVNEPNIHQWKEYAIWQYSDKGKVDGINTEVDMDRFAIVAPEVKPPVEKPTSVTVPSGTPLIGAHYTRTGELVKQFQEAFNTVARKIGYHTIGTDGVLGAETEGAIKALQNHGHLKVDGIYGSATAKVLEGLV